MNSKEKWRGIETTQRRKNERRAKTIINRFGQKSISLPRIDDKKRWAGYPGLTGVSRKIADIINTIPQFRIYVEPFAGTAKVYQMLDGLNHSRDILNDKSEFIYDWLKKEFSNNYCEVTKTDFVECIKNYDEEGTVQLIDPPWNKSFYLQKFSCFDRKSVREYDYEVLELCRKMKGKFIITSRKENKPMLDSEFRNAIITSEYVVSGKYPKVMITTNLEDNYLK